MTSEMVFFMSVFKITDVNDNLLKETLKQKSVELGISVDYLIEELIIRGLESFNEEKRFSSRNLSHDEIRVMLMKDKLNDLSNGVEYNQGSVQPLLNLINIMAEHH